MQETIVQQPFYQPLELSAFKCKQPCSACKQCCHPHGSPGLDVQNERQDGTFWFRQTAGSKEAARLEVMKSAPSKVSNRRNSTLPPRYHHSGLVPRRSPNRRKGALPTWTVFSTGKRVHVTARGSNRRSSTLAPRDQRSVSGDSWARDHNSAPRNNWSRDHHAVLVPRRSPTGAARPWSRYSRGHTPSTIP
eukprot:3783982-Rhodomonas_salina.1